MVKHLRFIKGYHRPWFQLNAWLIRGWSSLERVIASWWASAMHRKLVYSCTISIWRIKLVWAFNFVQYEIFHFSDLSKLEFSVLKRGQRSVGRIRRQLSNWKDFFARHLWLTVNGESDSFIVACRLLIVSSPVAAPCLALSVENMDCHYFFSKKCW